MKTEEQIKQNAEICVFTENTFRKEHKKLILTPSEEEIAKDFYIAGAHSRDEEIESLQKQIVHLSKREQMLFDREVELIAENDQLRNPWVSVEKRLPEIDKEVFVLFGEPSVAGIGYLFDDEDKAFMINGFGVIVDVTHWMPIPEIMKGE